MLGRIDLGLSDAEAWGLSPRILFQLLERRAKLEEARQRRDDYRFGTLAALYVNSYRDEKKRPEPFTWRDIFPQPEDVKKQPETQTEEQLLAALQIWTAATQMRSNV